MGSVLRVLIIRRNDCFGCSRIMANWNGIRNRFGIINRQTTKIIYFWAKINLSTDLSRRLGGSSGLEVMGGDSCSKGHGFES